MYCCRYHYTIRKQASTWEHQLAQKQQQQQQQREQEQEQQE
jgi:hypothetical protein